MKNFLLAVICLISVALTAQVSYYPPVPVGSGAWETVNPSDIGWCTDKLDELYIDLETNGTEAFIILKDGRIAVERYFGPGAAGTNYFWNQAGHPLVAFIAGMSRELRGLDITRPTSNFIGTWTSAPSAKESLITVADQLSMTTGLDNTNLNCRTPDCLTYVADAGTRWALHNGPFELVDEVIEETFGPGQGLNFQVGARLLPAMGIVPQFFPGNGFFGKAREAARVGLVLLAEGKWETTDIVADKDYIKEMMSSSSTSNPSYGYGTWINGQSSYQTPDSGGSQNGSFNPNAPADMVSGIGFQGAFIDIIPSRKLVVVRFGSSVNVQQIPLDLHRDMWSKLSEVLCNPVDVDEPTIDENLAFPNPFNKVIQIPNSTIENSVKLMDLSGRVVLSDNNVTELQTGHLPKGIYLLEVTDADSNRLIKKMIKQ